MKIMDTRVMRGPNYWSVQHHRLIVMKLAVDKPEHQFARLIPCFAKYLEKYLSSLCLQYNAEDHLNGLLEQIHEEDSVGHKVAQLALALQTLAGMPSRFSRTRSTDTTGVCHIVFEYAIEEAGLYAGEAAVRIAQAWAHGQEPRVEEDLTALRNLYARYCLGPSTEAIVEEARRRGIPSIRLDNGSLVQLGYGVYQRRIKASISSHTNCIAVDIAGSKEDTKQFLQAAAIPVPRGFEITEEAALPEAVEKVGFPLVIKPANGNQGNGATIKIRTLAAAKAAFAKAQRISPGVMVEQFIQGHDFRLLVVNYRLVAAALRTPAAITGNGLATIRALIEQTNQDPNRGDGHEKILTAIQVDDETLQLLSEQGLDLDSVLPAQQKIYLKRTANLSTGGTSTDVTDEVHPDTVHLAERIARIIGLDICGIDVMAPTLATPLSENGGAVLEVNAAPGLRMHLAPWQGKARNVASPIVDMLFPKHRSGRIPIVAVTGTNGKTTTTRLIAHLFKTAGKQVGYTTTDGVYLHDQLIQQGDCTGPASTHMILRDPTVDFAVLECARGGLLRAGLGFDQCDVGIVTNVAEDHLGLDDIHTLEQMARVKATIAESVSPNGYAVLNASNRWTYEMARGIQAKVALFSVDDQHPGIMLHCAGGGMAAVVEEGEVVIYDGLYKINILPVAQIPLTFGGTATCMIENVLPAVITGYVQGLKPDVIRQGLLSFIPSPQTMPGRFNLFHFDTFQVLVDYAHNPAGISALGAFIRQCRADVKVGIIAGIGDRKASDTVQLGRLAAEIFDEIIIRLDKDLRGKPADEIISLLRQGISQEAAAKPVQVIASEKEAIAYAIRHARPGSLIVTCSESVQEAIGTVQQCQAEARKTSVSWQNDDYREAFASPVLE